MTKTKKGSIVWDESADTDLLPFVRKAKWHVIRIKVLDRNRSMKDPTLAKEYAKKAHPIFTGDHTMLNDIPEAYSTGVVVHESVSKGEKFTMLCKSVESFFSIYRSTQVKNKVWLIKHTGQHEKKIGNLHEYFKKHKK